MRTKKRTSRRISLWLILLLIRGARSDECPVLLSVVVCCADVPDRDPFPGHDRSDPYCEVSAGGHTSKTSTKHNDNRPIWNEELEIGCVDASSVITVHCYDEDVGKDDSLLDERLYQWSDGGSYRLGGSNHWVDIEVSAVFPPTSVPSPSPTQLPLTNDIEDVQKVESRELDGPGGCFDSLMLGKSVELDNVRVTHVDSSSFFVAVGNSAMPWEGLRVLLVDDAPPPASSECGSVTGVVDEQSGETVLTNARFLTSSTTATCSVKPLEVSTEAIASQCGSVEAESLEGVKVVVSGESRVSLSVANGVSQQEIDDGSGPAVVVDGELPAVPEDHDMFVASIAGIVRYVQDRYGISVIAYGDVRYQTTTTQAPHQASSSQVESNGASPAFVAAIFISAIAIIALLVVLYLRANGFTFSGSRSRLRYYHRGRNELSERTYELTGFGGEVGDDDDDTLRTPNPLRDESLDQHQQKSVTGSSR